MNKILKTEYDKQQAEASIVLEEYILHRKKKSVRFETFDRFC